MLCDPDKVRLLHSGRNVPSEVLGADKANAQSAWSECMLSPARDDAMAMRDDAQAGIASPCFAFAS